MIALNSIAYVCTIALSSSWINGADITVASFTPILSLTPTATSCPNAPHPTAARTSLWTSGSSGIERSAIARPTAGRKTHTAVLHLSNSNDDGGGEGGKRQRQTGFRRIGGPVQPAIEDRLGGEEGVRELLRSRANARRAQNFKRADEILRTLGDAGVFVDDARRVWRADGFFSVGDDADHDVDDDDYDDDGRGGGGSRGGTSYVRSNKSKPMSDDDTQHVLKRLVERTRAKRMKDYDTADTIRDELRFLYHIEIDDATKTWCALGEEKSSFLKGDYVFGGKRVANIPEDDLLAIEDMIRQRVEAKRRKDYIVADAILEDLKVRYSVRVDDKKKLWHLYVA